MGFSLFLAAVYAQTPKLDSAVLGPGYNNDVFYNMKTGVVAANAGNNWHIAFAIRNAQPPLNTLRAATVLVNEGRNVSLYKSTQTNWATFDTAGFATWNNPHNSDTSWDVGAFNVNHNVNALDYGWGEYSMTSHNIDGKGQIFLLRLTKTVIVNGQPRTADSAFKKIRIESLVKDTQWVFTIANLNGTDSNRVVVSKSAFAGKLFAYYNMVSNALIDREPTAAWDVLFTRYGTFTTQFNITRFGATTGAFTYPTVSVSEVRGVPTDSATEGTYLTNINTIGTDWKINPGPGQPNFTIVDSLTYFVKPANGRIDKLVFKSITTSATGVITFEVTNKAFATGLNQINKSLNAQVYPNPATGLVYVSIPNQSAYTVNLFDIAGRLQSSNTLNANQQSIDISNLAAGIYLMQIEQNGMRKAVRLIVE